VYQAGTLSGNPLAVATGLKTLEILRRPGAYAQLEARAEKLARVLKTEDSLAGVPITVNRIRSMFTAFFTVQAVVDYASAKTSDVAVFGRFFRALLNTGVYFPPSQFEAAFVSTAHSEDDISQTVQAAAQAFAALKA
jgi:glutamate-1-semialdehyde 2,1-aminomutase